MIWDRALSVAAVLCLGAGVLRADAVEIRQGNGAIEIVIGGKPFTTYHYQGTAKPYLMPLRTAEGTVITRAFPVQNDIGTANPKGPSFEPHQRPLFFGHGNVNGLDFWEEEAFGPYMNDHFKQPYGRLELEGIQVAEGTIRARFKMLDPSGRMIAEQIQAFTFRGDSAVREIDCEFTILATQGPVTFGDTKEGTFAIRLTPELSGTRVRMVNSNGGEGEKAIWGKPADWVDFSGVVEGKQVGVAVLDGPASFRHPTTWHARAYGLLSANPFAAREFLKDEKQDGSWTVPEGKSIKFQYRVVIHSGDAQSAGIAAAYGRFAGK